MLAMVGSTHVGSGSSTAASSSSSGTGSPSGTVDLITADNRHSDEQIWHGRLEL